MSELEKLVVSGNMTEGIASLAKVTTLQVLEHKSTKLDSDYIQRQIDAFVKDDVMDYNQTAPGNKAPFFNKNPVSHCCNSLYQRHYFMETHSQPSEGSDFFLVIYCVSSWKAQVDLVRDFVDLPSTTLTANSNVPSYQTQK